MLKYLLILRFFSGFCEIEKGCWRPYGPPAIYKLIERLNAKGRKVEVLLACKDKTSFAGMKKPQHFRFEDLPHITFTVLPFVTIFPIARLNIIVNDIWQLLYSVARYFRFKPNVIYCVRATMPIGAFFTLFSKTKVVLRLMGESGSLSFFQDRRNKWLHPIGYYALCARYDTIIASLDGSRIQELLRHYAQPKQKAHVLLNGVERNGLMNRVLPKDEIIRILFVARLTNHKGSMEFIWALNHIIKSGRKCMATIVGYGEEEERIKEAISSEKLSHEVRFLGKIPHHDMMSLYASHDIFVSLNTIGNLNNAVLEAFSMGCCLVMLEKSNDGIDEDTEKVIGPEYALRISRVNTRENLAEQLMALIDNPSKINAYKKKTKTLSSETLKCWTERLDQEIKILEEKI